MSIVTTYALLIQLWICLLTGPKCHYYSKPVPPYTFDLWSSCLFIGWSVGMVTLATYDELFNNPWDHSLASNALGPRSELPMYQEAVDAGLDNFNVRPRPGTVHDLPWAGKDKFKVGQVLCNTYYKDGNQFDVDPQHIAAKQLSRLEAHGYALLSSFEMEFSLYRGEKQVPAFDGNEMFSQSAFSEFEDFALASDHQLSKSGVKLESLHPEWGPGQVEFTTIPKWGLKPADDVFIAKQAMKDIARNMGYQAVFITQPNQHVMSNGFHYNFSVWEQNREKNVFGGNSEGKVLSEFAEHWTAGLCEHGPALAALCAPTVNCYRRLNNPWRPCAANWGIADRNATFRIKPYGAYGVGIESRLPCSAANPYLVMAATLAAGLDGVERKLQCPPERKDDSESAKKMPTTLPEALEALQADEILVQALGPMFVSWYTKAKQECEIKPLKDFTPSDFSEEQQQKEFDMYFRL